MKNAIKRLGRPVHLVFLLLVVMFFSGKADAERCLQNSYEDNLGKPKSVMGNCLDTPLISLSTGKEKRKKFYEEAEKKILSRVNASDLPRKSTDAAVRVFMDENRKVKNVMSSGYSGNSRLDEALVKAAYEVGLFEEMPKSLVKEAKATGLIMKFQFTESPLLKGDRNATK